MINSSVSFTFTSFSTTKTISKVTPHNSLKHSKRCVCIYDDRCHFEGYKRALKIQVKLNSPVLAACADWVIIHCSCCCSERVRSAEQHVATVLSVLPGHRVGVVVLRLLLADGNRLRVSPPTVGRHQGTSAVLGAQRGQTGGLVVVLLCCVMAIYGHQTMCQTGVPPYVCVCV